jgi:hypothetical protein
MVEEEATKGQDSESGLLAKLQGFVSGLPVDQNILLYAVAVVAAIVLWRFLGNLFGFGQRGVVPAHDVRDLGRRIDELQDDVRRLQESVDLVVALLKAGDA